MIDYKNSDDYATHVLSLLGDKYAQALTTKSASMNDVRLRFVVFNAFYENIPAEEVADVIKKRFPYN